MTQDILCDMRTSAPPLLPIFRSRLQGELLAAVFLGEEEQSLTELAIRLGVSVATIQREADRLEKAGILVSRRVGRSRLFRPAEESRIVPPLKDLVLQTFGPAQVIAQHLASVPGIEQIILFGSWAARYEGVAGPPPADVDVLVIGHPSVDDVYEATRAAERQLRREVNVIVRSAAKWEGGDDPLVRSIRSSMFLTIPAKDIA